MQYMFSKCNKNCSGTLTIPTKYLSRWARQAETEYKDLSEVEKESDRVEADRIIAILTEDISP